MVRIRTAFVSGTILNNPLAIGDVTLSSAALSSLATVASPDTAMLILDPAGTAGTPEVVTVTAHTAAATTATITRGSEGSTARQHAVGVPWVHGPTTYDFLMIPQIVASNSAEVTTTSTGAVDLLTISNLNIPVTSGVKICGVARKTAGGAFFVAVGLKINSTVVQEASNGTNRVWVGSGTNQAEDGSFEINIAPRSANYLNSVTGSWMDNISGIGAAWIPLTATNPIPNATITSITLRGISGNAAVTLGVKEVVVIETKYALGL